MRYIDDLLLRDRGSERLYTMQDANWNVTCIANTSATIQERYAYSAYGTPAFLTTSFGSQSSSRYAWETLFCGYRYDVGTTLLYVRLRTLTPVLGTWTRRDPLQTPRAVINLTRYSDATPVSRTDPSGLDPYLATIPFHSDPLDELAILMYKHFPILSPSTYNPNQFVYSPDAFNPVEHGDYTICFTQDIVTGIAQTYVSTGNPYGSSGNFYYNNFPFSDPTAPQSVSPDAWLDQTSRLSGLYSNVVITGHGRPGVAGGFSIDELENCDSPQSTYLTQLGRRLLPGATVDVRCCQTAQDPRILKLIAKRCKAPTRGYTGNYAIWPYGTEKTAFPNVMEPRTTNEYPTTSLFGRMFGEP